MNDVLLTLAELENGLTQDKEYGDEKKCRKLLGRLLSKYWDRGKITRKPFIGDTLKISNYSDSVRQQGYCTMLIRFWVGFAGLPVYFPSSNRPVNLESGEIEPNQLLEDLELGPDSNPFKDLVIKKTDLFEFLGRIDLPLPVPDVQNSLPWFHGNSLSTETNGLFSKPRSSKCWDILSRITALKSKKEQWELMGSQPLPSEEKTRLEELNRIDTEIECLKVEDDKLWKFYESEDDIGSTKSLFEPALDKPAKDKQDAGAGKGIILTPPGTEWSDVRINFIDLDTIEVTPGKGKRVRRNYKNIACFYDQRKKSYSKAWWTLLFMARYQGNIPAEEKVDKKHVSILRGNLQKILPALVGDPFCSHKKGQGWQPRLSLAISEKIDIKRPQDISTPFSPSQNTPSY